LRLGVVLLRGKAMAEEYVEIKLDPAAYSVGAVLSTSYWLAESFLITVQSHDPELVVRILSREGQVPTRDDVDQIMTRLTDEELRARFRSQFHDIEKIIVEKAFSPLSGTASGQHGV
jgi:His-Xaa-Ser system protein HxsD